MGLEIKGCIPAVITHFKSEGPAWAYPINYDSLDKHLDYMANNDIKIVALAGCTGFGFGLSHNEQVELVKHGQENFGNKIGIIAGDGSNSTREAIDLAKRMEQEAGVFYHLSISPYGNKPSDTGILRHYTAIADAIQGKIILYSVPGRTGGKGILPWVAAELSYHPNIIGIKEASGNLERIKETIMITGNQDFFVISGDDKLTIPIIENGGVGVISVAANIVPGQMSLMIDYALEGKYTEARKINEKLEPLYEVLFPKSKERNPSPNPVVAHYMLRQMFDAGIPRLPLTDAYKPEKIRANEVLEKLKSIGYIEPIKK